VSSPRSTPRILAAALLGVGLLVGVSLPVPYIVLRPGPVFNVLGSAGGVPVISISGAKTYPTTGTMDMLTVSEAGGPAGRISLLVALSSWRNPSDAVVPTELLYAPGESAAQASAESNQQMLQSQDAAAVAALRYLNLPVAAVKVSKISPGSPALGHLRVGDGILAIDGVAVWTPDETVAQVSKHKPGDVIEITVLRGSSRVIESVVAGASPTNKSKAYLGIVLAPAYSSPIKVTITLNDVGGPSAGLMFTLGIIDMLTPGGQIGDQHVAGTGTIDQNGTVGAIGGIRQKMAAARADGATIFLLPADDCAEALLGVPAGLRLVKVSNLNQAVTELQAAIAGRTTPTCS
jgi:Lon-like protease